MNFGILDLGGEALSGKLVNNGQERRGRRAVAKSSVNKNRYLRMLGSVPQSCGSSGITFPPTDAGRQTFSQNVEATISAIRALHPTRGLVCLRQPRGRQLCRTDMGNNSQVLKMKGCCQGIVHPKQHLLPLVPPQTLRPHDVCTLFKRIWVITAYTFAPRGLPDVGLLRYLF